MKCRGHHHQCELCPKMGKKSSASWNAWLASEGKILRNPKPHDPRNPPSGQGDNPDGETGDSEKEKHKKRKRKEMEAKFVSKDDFNTFSDNIHSMLQSVLKAVNVPGSGSSGSSTVASTSTTTVAGGHTSRSSHKVGTADPPGSRTPSGGGTPMPDRSRSSSPKMSMRLTSGSDNMSKPSPKMSRQLASGNAGSSQHSSTASDLQMVDLELGDRSPFGDDDEDDDDDDDDRSSLVSSWDHKRGRKSADREEASGGEEEEGEPSAEPPSEEDRKATEVYVTAMTQAIKDLNIADAEVSAASQNTFFSTKFKNKKATAKVPFREEHRYTVDKVWSKNPSKLATYKKEVTERYKIAAKDYDKYLKTAKLDIHLRHELQRCRVKLADKPRLPDKRLAPVEAKLRCIELQGRQATAAAVSSSWLLQHAGEQIMKLETILKDTLSPSDFAFLNGKVKINDIIQSLKMGNDGLVDLLDLQARQVSNAVMMRRSMWLEYTDWSDAIKNEIKRFPISGDGTLCGPQLKESLESLRLTAKALDAAEAIPGVGNKRSNDRKRPASKSQGGPQNKKMRLNTGYGRGAGHQGGYSGNYQGGYSGRGGKGRGQKSNRGGNYGNTFRPQNNQKQGGGGAPFSG